MKNWKKWLVAGCMAALLGIGTMGTTAMAMGGGGVDRSEAVAEEEKVPSGKATQDSRASSKAWKKINGVCYNGSGQKLEGAVTRGIDVSEWQDTINWSQVKKSNVDFAFVRISYGLNHLDKTYDYNMKQAGEGRSSDRNLCVQPCAEYTAGTEGSTACHPQNGWI